MADTNPDVVRQEGQVLTGKVKAWDLTKGYGFATVDDGGSDLFLHQSVVQVEGSRYRAIAVDTKIELVYTLRDGKGAASSVTLPGGAPLPGFETRLEASKLMSIAKSVLAVPSGQLAGKVKWFNQEKGFGFIKPDDGTADMFVNIRDVHDQKVLVEDEPVAYSIINRDGKDRAGNVISLLRPDAQQQPLMPQYMPPMMGGMPGLGMGGMPGMGSLGMPAGYPGFPQGQPQFGLGLGGGGLGGLGGPPPPAAAPMLAGKQSGTIKWFNEEKGFGFIIADVGGAEIYFKRDEVMGGGNLGEADPVEFELKEARGKTWATNVIPRRRGAPAKRKADPYGGDPYAADPYADPYAATAKQPRGYDQPPSFDQFQRQPQTNAYPGPAGGYSQQFDQYSVAAPGQFPGERRNVPNQRFEPSPYGY